MAGDAGSWAWRCGSLMLMGMVTAACGASGTVDATIETSEPTTGTVVGEPVDDPVGELPEGAEVVTVVSVIDGDTIEVSDGSGDVATVRLIGINSPERGECHAEEATEVLEALVPVGTEIGMTTDVSDTDQYGRLLRYLWLGGMSVNEESVRRGASMARRYPPDTAMADRMESAQSDARRAGAGLWAAEACGTAANARLRIVEVEFDAPGDDGLDPNGEWVRVRNEGSEPVAMTGWAIKDESSSHRYRFPPSFTLGAEDTVLLRTGCGDDSQAELFWCTVGSAVWNNDGDTAFLLDPHGNTHDARTFPG